MSSVRSTKRGQYADANAVGESSELDYVCSMCDRTGRTPNPCPKRHQGAYLRFANSTQCLGCRNTCNGPLKAKAPKIIRAELKIPEKKEAFKAVVFKHEEMFDQNMSVKDIGGHLAIPEFLKSADTIEHESRKLVDNWGLFRDAKYQPVSGCVVATKARTKTLTLEKDLANSSRSVVDNEASDMFQRMDAATGATNVNVDSDGIVTLQSTGKGGHNGCDDADSRDDLLPKSRRAAQSKNQEPSTDDSSEKPRKKKKKHKFVKSKSKKTTALSTASIQS